MYALKENLIMATHYDKQLKFDAVQYYHDHKDLGLLLKLSLYSFTNTINTVSK